jgi:hypothetical protein
LKRPGDNRDCGLFSAIAAYGVCASMTRPCGVKHHVGVKHQAYLIRAVPPGSGSITDGTGGGWPFTLSCPLEGLCRKRVAVAATRVSFSDDKGDFWATIRVVSAPQYSEFGGFGAFRARELGHHAIKIKRTIVKFSMQGNRELL